MRISFSSVTSAITSFFTGTPAQDAAGTSPSGFRLWGADGFSFADILDIVNPLQHIPVVSTVYRALTGDSLAPAPRVLGDTLFGGPIGAAVGAANALLEYASGKDVGEHVLRALHLPSHAGEQTILLAAHQSPALASPAPLATVAQPQRNAVFPAVQEMRRLTALDAYARSSRLQAAFERQGTHRGHF